MALRYNSLRATHESAACARRKPRWENLPNEPESFPHIAVPLAPRDTQTVALGAEPPPAEPPAPTLLHPRLVELIDARIEANLARERDLNTSPPFRLSPPAGGRPDRHRPPPPPVVWAAALADHRQKLAGSADPAEAQEAERVIAVLEAILDGKPPPRELGVPIIAVDGSVSFAELSSDKSP
jgi:hypothetical protein